MSSSMEGEEEYGLAPEMVGQITSQVQVQWQRAITGMVALPAAIALSAAAGVLYGALFVERGFEVLRRTAEQARRDTDRERERFERGREGGERQRPTNELPRA